MTKDTHNWEDELDNMVKSPLCLKEMEGQCCFVCGQPYDKSPQVADLKAFIKQVYQAGQEDEEQIVKAELEKILEQGHGGGNWRRLIMEAIEKL